MSKKGNSKNDLKGLTYVAQKPSFLANFGKPREPSPPPGRAGASRDRNGNGREPLPERPTDGEWAGGSDHEPSDDEWGDVYGGGGDDGPQVVVLKEGRHLSADEVKRERRRAAGRPSVSPEPDKGKEAEEADKATKPKSTLPPKVQSSAKRKLVGKDADSDASAAKSDKAGGKKKKKSDKKLLSFDEEE